MQILAERYYKTRGGDRAYVSAVEDSSKVPNGSRPRMCPILGYLKGASVAWYCNGSFRMDGKEDAWDLLEEWKEPVGVQEVPVDEEPFHRRVAGRRTRNLHYGV